MLLVFLVLLVAGLASSCSDGEASDAVGMVGATSEAELEQLDVDTFEQRLDDGGEQVVINVHTPYEGEIEGTDEFIVFDEIVDHPDLPADRSAPLLLYCRSGNMSQQAGDDLIAAGYTDVAHLDGGMNAWEASGRTLLDEQR